VASRYGSQPGAVDDGHQAALVQLWHLAYRGESTLAFADAFRAIMVPFVIATVLVPLLRKPAAPVPAEIAH
jgi:DHA2 family multidrug resistance protein